MAGERIKALTARWFSRRRRKPWPKTSHSQMMNLRDRYFSQGGKVHRYPPGHSGKMLTKRQKFESGVG